jgi:hypothetical protein
MIAGLAAQKEVINSYGDLDFNTANRTRPSWKRSSTNPLSESGTPDSTTLGRACANTSCTILASFATQADSLEELKAMVRCGLLPFREWPEA